MVVVSRRSSSSSATASIADATTDTREYRSIAVEGGEVLVLVVVRWPLDIPKYP